MGIQFLSDLPGQAGKAGEKSKPVNGKKFTTRALLTPADRFNAVSAAEIKFAGQASSRNVKFSGSGFGFLDWIRYRNEEGKVVSHLQSALNKEVKYAEQKRGRKEKIEEVLDEKHPLVTTIREKYYDKSWEMSTHAAGTLLHDSLPGATVLEIAQKYLPAIYQASDSINTIKAFSKFMVESASTGSLNDVQPMLKLMEGREGITFLMNFMADYRADNNTSPMEQPSTSWLKWLAHSRNTLEQIKDSRWQAMKNAVNLFYKGNNHKMADDRYDLLKLKQLVMFNSLPINDDAWGKLQKKLEQDLTKAPRHTGYNVVNDALFSAYLENQTVFSEKWLDNFENLLGELQDSRLNLLKSLRAQKLDKSIPPARREGLTQLSELMIAKNWQPPAGFDVLQKRLVDMPVSDDEWKTVLQQFKDAIQTGKKLDAETLYNAGLAFKENIPLNWFESVQALGQQQRLPHLTTEYLKLFCQSAEGAVPASRQEKALQLLKSLAATGNLNDVLSFKRLMKLPVTDEKWTVMTDYLARKLGEKGKVALSEYVSLAAYGQSMPIPKGKDMDWFQQLIDGKDFKLDASVDKQLVYMYLKLLFTDKTYPNNTLAGMKDVPVNDLRRERLMKIVDEIIDKGAVSSNPAETIRHFKLLAQLPVAEEHWLKFTDSLLEAVANKKTMNFEEFFATVLYGKNPETLPENIRKIADTYINYNWAKSSNKQITYHFLKGKFMDKEYPISELRREMLLKILDDAIANGYTPKAPSETINSFELFSQLPVTDDNWKKFAASLHDTVRNKQKYSFEEYLASTLYGKEAEELPEGIRKLAAPYLKYDWSKSENKQIAYTYLKQHFIDPDLPISKERRSALQEILDAAIEKKSVPNNPNASIEKFKLFAELPLPEPQWLSLAAALKAGISSGQSFDLDQYMSCALMDIDPATLPEKLQKLAKNNSWMTSTTGSAKQIPYIYLKQYFANPDLPISNERRETLQKILYEAIENKYNVGNVQETLTEFKLFAELPVSELKWDALSEAFLAQIRGKSSFKMADYLACGLADENVSELPQKWQDLLKKYNWQKSQSDQVQYIYLKQYFANPSLPLSDKRRAMMQKLLSNAIQFQYKRGEKEEVWKLFSRMPVSDTLWTSLVNNVIDEAMPKKKSFSIKNMCNYIYWENQQKVPKEWMDEYGKLVPFEERKEAWKKIQLSKSYASANTPDEITFLDQILASSSAGLVDFFPESEIPLGLGATYVKVMQGDELAFVKMMPHFLTEEYTPSHFQRYMSRFESGMDNYRGQHGRGRGHHPNEAELMLLFRNPGVLKGKDGTISNMTAAITSIDRWIEYQISEVDDSLLRVWGNIGFLAHSFLFWRFDTQGGPGSLFGQYGFQPIAKRETDKIFGPGYMINKQIKPDLPINDKTLIEFRRGYMLATNSQWGTLVIRNSSPVFGRDLMKHSAYYSKQSFTADDLRALNPGTDNRFQPILRPHIYMDTGGARRVQQLTEELNLMKKSYAKWKLDISPDGFQDKVFQGHKNGGFAKIIEFLEKRSAELELGLSKQPLPELAFVNPNYPAYWSYSFTDANGNKAERYKITPERLGELKDLLANQWNTQKYPNSDWVRFLQAGIDNGAELILMAPETN